MSIYYHRHIHKDNPLRLSQFNKEQRKVLFKVFDELFPEHSKSHRRQELCEDWIVGMGHYDGCYYTKEDIVERIIILGD